MLALPVVLVALHGRTSSLQGPSAHVASTLGHDPDAQTRGASRHFKAHNLGVHCFDVWGCKVAYGDRVVWKEPASELKPPVEQAMPRGRSLMRATQGVFRAFEGPMALEWHDRQRVPRYLRIDLSQIFPERILRHAVARSDISTTATIGPPDIIVEIEDRTVRVYMRALIPLKHPRRPADRGSDSVDELITVFEETVGGTS